MSDRMTDKVRRFIDDNKLLKTGDKVIVALSGGADSVGLLHIFISIKEIYNLELYAAHFNHGIRGEEADRDEAFVRKLCERWGIGLHYEKADVPAVAAQTGESVELCGRRLRYDFFDDIIRYHRGAKIATAHHLGDNAETVIWNLTRGSGIGGLCGIPSRRGNIIRPLLGCSREDIEEYCKENSLEYVTDSTNLSDDYTRNRIRHQVMPVLRGLNDGAEENISRTSQVMREADEYLNKISKNELSRAKTEFGYSCEKLLQLEPIILKYAVKNVLKNAEAPVDFRHVGLIIEKMRDGGAVQLGMGYTAVCAQGVLRIACDSKSDGDYCVPLSEYLKQHGTRIRVRDGRLDFSAGNIPFITEEGAKINNLFLKHCIPCDIITSDTVLRHRRAGDTFTDSRRGVTKTLKKLMNELKIPRELRDTYLVIAEGSTVLWLQNYGTSAQAKTDLTRDGDIIFL